MHIHNKVFNAGQWYTFRFLLEFEGVETRGSSFSFFICSDYGGAELLEREQGRGVTCQVLG